ncbi:sulfur carrier protein ThiS [Cohnella zeiphila]|uniref:Sulfur carrier protein ThiS n=1 Tax=Cohnella zeiphila TaxID=2761120 RepID=A0A7X0VY97_9BACL|nr:sulfur carrier protein ThiS [Cohnella zeiphila]MBB6734257.1 sulfur carrier protein ThiS [Cohnella zeiphila]
MELTINGITQQLEVRTVGDVIAHFGLEGKPVVVEADGEIVDRERWGEAELRQGMKLELVHFVGGG